MDVMLTTLFMLIRNNLQYSYRLTLKAVRSETAPRTFSQFIKLNVTQIIVIG